ncbi:SPX domain-containing protein [Circinella umbellata]|nr:SPX domain-containing protein [Circinella umbellata]
MKFAKYLESESIPEWRKAYINYKGLKKRLKAVDKFRKANERKAAIELDHAFQGIVDADSDSEQPPRRPTLYKQDTAATNEWRWPWNVDNTNSAWLNENPPLHRQQSFPHSLIRRISSRFNQDDTELARVHSRPVSINSSATLSILDEALLHASEAERVFFAILNGELDKVSRFYDEKEIEARTKLEALKIQMQLIAEYGRRLLEIEDAEEHHRHQQQQNGYGVPLPNGFDSNNNRQEQDSQGGWFDWITGHHRNKSSNHDASRIPLHLPQMSSTIDYSADHHVARSRLKKALTEYYRSLEFLRSYKVLNETGFHKIMKKFDKTAGWKASQLYLQRVKKYHWVTSTELDSIIKETETLYINEFADGHRRRGMRKLRVPEKQEDYNSTTLRIGLYLGMALILLLRSCQLGFEPKTGKQLPNIQTNLQIYACFALPILFCLGFSTNLIIWHRSRISYKFIFELDPRHNLNYHQFGEVSFFFL